MNTNIRQRAVTGGINKTAQLDPLSLVRLAYCERIAIQHLGVRASFSTIVRRSLVLYQAHCEALFAGSIGKPEDSAIYRRIEAVQLNIVNKGSPSDVVTVEMVRDSPELRTIGDLQRAATVPRPILNDKLKGELKNWTPSQNRG